MDRTCGFWLAIVVAFDVLNIVGAIGPGSAAP
jgi:hypothetical protein